MFFSTKDVSLFSLKFWIWCWIFWDPTWSHQSFSLGIKSATEHCLWVLCAMTIYDYDGIFEYTILWQLDDLGLWLKPNLPQSERCPTSNPWVQSPCRLGVVTSINTHTDEHEAGMAGKYPFKTCPKIRNVNNHVQPPPNNQFLWVSIPCWYFVLGFYIWINLWDLHLVTWLPEFSGAQVVEPPSASARRSQREAGIWCHRWLLMTEQLVLYSLLRLLLSDSANG